MPNKQSQVSVRQQEIEPMIQTGLIPTAHSDLITDASYDFYGLRLATCSLDQRYVNHSYSRGFLVHPLFGLKQDKSMASR